MLKGGTLVDHIPYFSRIYQLSVAYRVRVGILQKMSRKEDYYEHAYVNSSEMRVERRSCGRKCLREAIRDVVTLAIFGMLVYVSVDSLFIIHII